MKLCTTCGIEKELDAFYNYKKGPQGKSYRCKPCDTAARKSYEARHPQRTREGHRRASLLSKYGITIEQFDKMWEDQKGCCQICDVELSNAFKGGSTKNASNTANVDHCHTEGHVRGILCATCNKALGLFKDRPDLLRKAANYLEEKG